MASHTRLILLVLLAALGLPAGASGQVTLKLERNEGNKAVRFQMLGGYRAGLHAQDGFAIDPGGSEFYQRLYLDHRLRFQPVLTVRDVFILGGELDLLTGVLGGFLPDLTAAYDERLRWTASGLQYAEIRQLYIKLEPQRFHLEAGMLVDHWGLGAVANGGGPAAAGFGDDPFGTDAFGDQVLRVGMTVLPAVSGGTAGHIRAQFLLEMPVRDEQTQLFARKDVYFGPAIRVLYDAAMAKAGLWVCYRNGRQATGDTAEHLQVDLFFDRSLPLGRQGASFRLAMEGAGRVGRTAFSDGWPALGRRQIVGGALVVEGGIGFPGPRAGSGLEFGLRGGLASGDDDPADEVETGFELDRDYNAGLILFDEVMAGASARNAKLIGEASGYDNTRYASEGAIEGAAFAMPFVAWSPHPRVQFRLGGMLAAATTPPVFLVESTDPDAASIERGQRFLGGELNAAVEVDAPLLPEVQPRTRFGFRLEYGHLFPGPALTEGWDIPVGQVDLLSLRVGMTF